MFVLVIFVFGVDIDFWGEDLSFGYNIGGVVYEWVWVVVWWYKFFFWVVVIGGGV